MNKKLQNGLTITASMAMAMGVGIPVTTVLAASATTTAPASTYGVEYQGHVQNIGWQTPTAITLGEKTDISLAAEAGTNGKSLRVEALKLTGINLPAGASIEYQAQVQNKGWMPAVTTLGDTPIADAEEAGTDGKSLRVETFKITLHGVPGYAIEYQTHVQNRGWMPAVQTENGTNIADAKEAGTVGQSLRMEALKIEIVKTDAEKLVEVNAINALETAKTSKTPADIALATTAINLVQDVAEKATLTVENAAITPVVTSLAVSSVSAINATQVNIAFNNAVDPTSLFTVDVNGKLTSTFKAGTVALTSIDGVDGAALTGVLSTDGKTLTVTSTNPLSKRYDATVNNLLGMNGTSIDSYDNIVTFNADITAPTIVSTTKTSASTFKVVFSEPLSTLGTQSYKLADGTDVSVANGFVNGVSNDFAPGSSVVNFTIGSAVLANAQVNASFIGAQDEVGNLLTPNPATTSFVKGDKDGVAPTVTSITQTGAKTFAVKFSEQLVGNPVVELGSPAIPVAVGSIVKDTTDPTVYNVTAPGILNDTTDVAVGTFMDLSGEAGINMSKVVNFVEDFAAPTVVSSVVSVDATTGKEYLDTTFNKNVNLTLPTVAATGTSAKNYITTTLAPIAGITAAYKNATDKTVVRVELATLLAGQDVSSASYNLNLTFTGIASEAGVAATTSTTTFTRGVDGVPANTTVLPSPVITAGSDNNKVNVKFTGTVDGSSATNVSNYNVDGAVVKSVTLLPATTVLDVTTQIAVLNLTPGSDTFTGVRNIHVSNVKALGSSSVMAPYATTVNLNENVAPTVVFAKLTKTNEITVTFSEPVVDGVLPDVNDFEVLVGNKSLTIPELVNAGIGVTPSTTATISITAADAATLEIGRAYV